MGRLICWILGRHFWGETMWIPPDRPHHATRICNCCERMEFDRGEGWTTRYPFDLTMEEIVADVIERAKRGPVKSESR